MNTHRKTNDLVNTNQFFALEPLLTLHVVVQLHSELEEEMSLFKRHFFPPHSFFTFLFSLLVAMTVNAFYKEHQQDVAVL